MLPLPMPLYLAALAHNIIFLELENLIFCFKWTMTLLGRWHFLSNLINNKTYSNKSWYFDSSEIVSLHFYVQNNFNKTE